MEIPRAESYGGDIGDSQWYLDIPEDFNFNDLRQPAENILNQLRESIERGEYGLIIGDDASGRLPTLLLSGVLKQIYRERNHKSLSVQFFAGDRSKADADYCEQLAGRFAQQFLRLQHQDNGRVLIVTELLDTGSAIQPLALLLKKHQIPFDVATISMLDFFESSGEEETVGKSPSEIFQLEENAYEKHRQMIEDKIGGRVVWGGYKDFPSVYRNPHAAGVVREPGKPVAVLAKGGVHPRLLRDELQGKPVLQEYINKARENIALLVDEVSASYLQKGINT